MKITIEKRFLLIPYCEEAQRKKLLFRQNGKIMLELDVRLGSQPDFYLPYDMQPWLEQTMEMETLPAVHFLPQFTDQIEKTNLYTEKYRPVTHFSADSGWINDPNGLVFYEGKYHLFFQHNPAGTRWDNMHWGHAISEDLLHWQQAEDILFPDEYGTMFSGCAVIDERNVTGLKCNEHDPLLLFYTAAGGTSLKSKNVPFTQRLAYSTDGCATFQKYGQTIVPHIAHENRDPKIIFSEELNQYIMALFLQGRDFMLLTSSDLLHWQEIQRLRIEEDDECPDFYPLELEGERYWVITAAHDHYLIGKITNGYFMPLQKEKQLHFGEWYAAQTFFGLSNHRRIRFSWNKARIPRMPFQGSMSTPHDLFLRRIQGEICLCAQPIPEWNRLHREKIQGCGRIELPGKAHDLIVTLPAKGRYSLEILGLQLIFDLDQEKVFHGKEAIPCPVSASPLQLRIIQDVHAIEIYINQGEEILCIKHIADYTLPYISCPGTEISGWTLESIWE